MDLVAKTVGITPTNKNITFGVQQIQDATSYEN